MKNIFLVGLPGSGKTTIGKELSTLLNIPFLDTDDIICLQEGKTIEEIFNEKGENYFRELEKKTLHKLLKSSDKAIVSTGGGLPCFFDNMEKINEQGVSVFLNVSPETITTRLWNQRDHNRPMIKGKSKEELLEFLQGKLKERISYYSKATITANGENISAKEIVNNLNLNY